MTPTDKKQKVQEIAAEGLKLVNKAETLLQQVILRDAQLTQEMKQSRVRAEAGAKN